MQLKPLYTYADYNEAKAEFVRLKVSEPNHPHLDIWDVLLADFERNRLTPIKRSWWFRAKLECRNWLSPLRKSMMLGWILGFEAGLLVSCLRNATMWAGLVVIVSVILWLGSKRI